MKSTDTCFIKAAKFIFIFFIFLKSTPAFNQVYGCTDPSANNYNPSATDNNGSCTYNDTYYTPPAAVDPISDTLKESSGLQWAGNALWSFNDRGGTPDLYRINPAGKAILQTVRLSGATNVDWEDAAFDGTYFYIGDFGNNLNGSRTNLKIYKFPVSAIPDHNTHPQATIAEEQIEVISFTYSDQPQPPASAALNTTKFDCEAMIVDEGKIHLFTKDWVDFTSTHYVINNVTAGTYVAEPAETLDAGYLVTSADKVAGKKVTVLLGYENSGFGTHYMHILSDYREGNYFNGNKRKITLPGALYMGQAEGITFINDTIGYITNEQFEQSIIMVNQKLYSFNTAGFVPAIILALELQGFNVSKISGTNKISWNFNSLVHDLEIQQSADGVHFNVIKTYSSSSTGTLENKPANPVSYYRLAWKQNNGEYQYSKIIRIKNEDNNLIRNLVLRATGELSFTLSGNESEDVTFKLLTADGKTISQIAGRTYTPGFNKINFRNKTVLNGVVLLTVYSNKQKTTRLLHVVK